MSNLNIYT